MGSRLDNIKKAEDITNQKIIDTCLNELSELKFDKTQNILRVLIGGSSPIIPLIYLYRKDLFEKMDFIEVLVIGICINMILLFMINYINILKNYLKIYCQYLKLSLEMNSIKASNVLFKKYLISAFKNIENKDIDNLDKLTKIKFKLAKLFQDKEEKGYSNLKTIVTYMNDKRTYEIFKNDFLSAININIIVGSVVILIKLATFVKIVDINFKEICWILIFLYSITLLICIFRIVKMISIISITYVYKIIGRGYVQETEEQITFFD